MIFIKNALKQIRSRQDGFCINYSLFFTVILMSIVLSTNGQERVLLSYPNKTEQDFKVLIATWRQALESDYTLAFTDSLSNSVLLSISSPFSILIGDDDPGKNLDIDYNLTFLVELELSNDIITCTLKDEIVQMGTNEGQQVGSYVKHVEKVMSDIEGSKSYMEKNEIAVMMYNAFEDSLSEVSTRRKNFYQIIGSLEEID